MGQMLRKRRFSTGPTVARTIEYGDSRTCLPERRGYYRLAQSVVLQAYRDLHDERIEVALEALFWFLSGEADALLLLTGIEPPAGGALYAWCLARRRRIYLRKLNLEDEMNDRARSICIGDQLKGAVVQDGLEPEEFGVFVEILQMKFADLVREARQEVKARRKAREKGVLCDTAGQGRQPDVRA